MVDVLSTEATDDVSKEVEYNDTTHCMICREYMFEPRSFDCGHSFCLGCQIQLFRVAEKYCYQTMCPKCRKSVKRVTINFGLRDLVEALNPIAYKQSGKFYDESHDKRMIFDVSSCLSSEQKERLLEKDEKKFQRCCKVVFRFQYWILEIKNKSKFKHFLDDDSKKNGDTIRFLTIGSTANFADNYVKTFFSVTYKTTTYIFF